MNQQILTIVITLIAVSGTLLGAYLNSRSNYKIASEKIKSDEKQNDLKIKLELKKTLYLDYFEHLSQVHTFLVRIINEPESRNKHESISILSSSINKIKLVAESKIVLKIFEIEENYINLHAFIMKNIFAYSDKEVKYENQNAQQQKIQAEVDELKNLLNGINDKDELLHQEIIKKLKEKSIYLDNLIDENLDLFLIIFELRKKLMKESFKQIENLESLNKDLILLMREDIGLENDSNLLQYFARNNSENLKSAIYDLLDSAIKE